MLFKDISIMNEAFQVQEHMYVRVEGDRITYAGTQCPKYSNAESIYNGSNKLLLPGFVNSHAHTPMTLLRGYSENKTLQDWLFHSIFPFEGNMTSRDVYTGMMLGIAEMLRFGIVSTTDMYFSCEAMCEAALETKTKFNICNGTTCFDDKDYIDNTAYKETQAMLKAYHGANQGAILADASIHAEYTSNPRIVKQVTEYAKEHGLNMHLHISETRKEHEECIARHGKTPTAYFADLGAFDLRTTAAHCVWVSEEDMEILKEKNVTVSSNPVSNLKLASGVCPVPRLMEKGVSVSIGTDGMASNNNLNMLEDIKLFAILHKGVSYDPRVITPAETLKAATWSGFQAQGRLDSGFVKEGYKADLIVIDMDQPWYKPVHNAMHNLLYAGIGSDVCLTMTDGKILYQDGEYTTLDIEKVQFEAERSVREILGKL